MSQEKGGRRGPFTTLGVRRPVSVSTSLEFQCVGQSSLTVSIFMSVEPDIEVLRKETQLVQFHWETPISKF